MTTYRGIAIALGSAVDRAELERMAELLLSAAADLEMQAEDEIEQGKKRIIARRADRLGGLGLAIEAELEKAKASP